MVFSLYEQSVGPLQIESVEVEKLGPWIKGFLRPYSFQNTLALIQFPLMDS